METSKMGVGFLYRIKNRLHSHVTWFLCFALSGLLFKQND